MLIIPNVSAAVIMLGLGCEVNQIDHYLGRRARARNRPRGMTLQRAAEPAATVEAARREIRRLSSRPRKSGARTFPPPRSCWV